MAVTVSYYNKFWENVGKNVIHLENDTFDLVLVNGYVFDGANEDETDLGSTEIDEAFGYTTGGQTLLSPSFAYDSGQSKTIWDANDASWSATGGDIGPTSGAVIIDRTAGDLLVAYIDFGQSETAGQDTAFKVTFNPLGIFTIA